MLNKPVAAGQGRKRRIIVIELLAIAILSVIVFKLSGYYDVVEQVLAYMRRHEIHELDELISVAVFLVVGFAFFSLHRWCEARTYARYLQQQSVELQQALDDIKQLRSFLPICSSCKQIRDDDGEWHPIEAYISEHTNAEFSHDMCPGCIRSWYPELATQVEGQLNIDHHQMAPHVK
ncbi:MAG: hypothetical protein Tsb002_14650 [Wenzhouxiangellaceae bacterium]